jgi:hypothetical protein
VALPSVQAIMIDAKQINGSAVSAVICRSFKKRI